MAHENVTGESYRGTEVSDLRALVSEVVDDHYLDNGYGHSVRGDYRIVSGTTSSANFWRRANEGRGTSYIAQRIYAEEDMLTKTVSVTIPLADLAEANEGGWRASSPLVQKALQHANVTKLTEAGWTVKETTPDAKFSARGRQGLELGAVSYKKTASTSPVKLAYYITANTFNKAAYGPYLTLSEAQKGAESLLERNPGATEVTIEKKALREDGSAIAVVRPVAKKIRYHIEVTVEKPKAGAKAKGWAVVMDCHH